MVIADIRLNLGLCDVADLDISQAEGPAALQQRLKMAAKRVCYVNDGTLSLKARIRRQECFD